MVRTRLRCEYGTEQWAGEEQSLQESRLDKLEISAVWIMK